VRTIKNVWLGVPPHMRALSVSFLPSTCLASPLHFALLRARLTHPNYF
jgi:hypothetical protein